ncbi:hypothetical protein KA013_01815 [Patescibacteria group bacterium]|nr:hypothetical protein [Patescibacteria group bacterium]
MKALFLFFVLTSLTSSALQAQSVLNCPPDTTLDAATIYPLLVQQGLTEHDYKPSSVLVTEDAFSSVLGSISAKYVSTKLLWKCDGDDITPRRGLKNVVGCVERTFYNRKQKPVYIQQAWLISSQNLFSEENITWPKDLVIDLKDGKYNHEVFFDLTVNDLRKLGVDKTYLEPSVIEVPYSLIGISSHDEIRGGSRNPHEILRKWVVIDWCQYGRDSITTWDHTQTISFTDSLISAREDAFSEQNIVWPRDFGIMLKDTTNLAAQMTPDEMGWKDQYGVTQYASEPEFALFSAISVGTRYTDTIVSRDEREDYDDVYVTHFDVHRRWTVLDWDRYDAAPGKGIWQHTQVIRVSYLHKKE